ncbi:MAG: ABC transporter substrate-binding protein [Desulfuromonadales bacterium]
MPSAAWSKEPLRISVSRTPLSLPFFIAENLGYFRSEGLSLDINEVIGGHRAMQEVLEGKSDLCTSSESVVMFNSFKTSDFAVLATFVSSTADVKIISRAGTGIDHPQKLAGKRVGTVLGSASHYYLDTSLLMHGVDPDAVKKLGLEPEAMGEALKNGKVDAVAVWEPYPFKILESVPGTRIVPTSNHYRLTFNLSVHKKHLGTRDDELVKVLRALERAQQYIEAHPAEAQAILRAHLQIDQPFIDWLWPTNIYRLTLEQSLLTTLESEARWALQGGYVKGERVPNYLEFIHTGPLKNVNPSAVTLIE